MQQHKRQNRIKRKALIWILAGVMLLICLNIAWSWWTKVWFIPIEVVTLKDKLQYASPELVKAAVDKEVKRGFFGVRLEVMRDKLLQVPWIVDANVHRKWPNTVIMQVHERQPLAIWAGKGVIDTEGKLFFPPSLDQVKDLPEFNGDKADLNAMVDTYLWLLAKIKPIGLGIKTLTIMPDHGWRTMLDNGVSIILGQNELEERLTRFVIAYSDAKSGLHDDRVKVVDLRYTNGLAVAQE